MRAKDNAATRIQAGFRGYRVRKQLRMQAQGKRPNGPRRSSAVGTDNGTASPIRKQPAFDAEPPASKPAAGAEAGAEAGALERSATKIQAGVRGFLVRRRRLAQHRAACTIQAGFRAFRARRDARLRAAPAARI